MNGDDSKKPDEGNWQFKTNSASPNPTPAPLEESAVQNPTDPANWLNHASLTDTEDGDDAVAPEVGWNASEFIAHEKGVRWFAGLAGVTLLLVLLAYFVIHDMVAVVAIIAIAIIFAMLATHKPRVLAYHVGPEGITIGRKTYLYTEFKNFGVVQEEAFSNITLVPTGRFAPLLSIYYPPEEEKHIMDVLSNYLPFAPVTYDGLDKFLHRIRM